MTTRGIKVISFNVNGLTNPIKRSRILNKMKKDRAQIVYLQETHLNNNEHEKLRRMGFTNMFSSAYESGRRRGVVILISRALNFEKSFELKDKDGRFILVRGTVDGNQVTLMNVYAPPGSDLSFFKYIVNIMVTETQGPLICGGDLNIRLQPDLDSSKRKKPGS
uniref:exodeoxyribonuclease III n=1 Tax=Astatotilapia calliptera TaxID=8154 RepID=A0AAX7TZQ2_ASTCA